MSNRKTIYIRIKVCFNIQYFIVHLKVLPQPKLKPVIEVFQVPISKLG